MEGLGSLILLSPLINSKWINSLRRFFSVSNCLDVDQAVLTGNKHQVLLGKETSIVHSSSILPHTPVIPNTSSSKTKETSVSTKQVISKSDVSKTPPGFKPRDQNASHYLGPLGRGHSHLVSALFCFCSDLSLLNLVPSILCFFSHSLFYSP